MKTVTMIACLCLSLLAPSCGVSWDVKEIASYAHERNHAPPESGWNGARIWKRVSDQPATYLPTGYPTQAPRSAAHGEWIEDARDGKRFFVPRGSVNGLSEQVIRKDALKHSGPTRPTAEPAGIMRMP